MLEIIQGETQKYTIRIKDKANLDPVDLTSAEDIKTHWKNEDCTVLDHSLEDEDIEIVGNPILGKIQGTLTTAQTMDLKLGKRQVLEITVIFANETKKMQIVDAYNVIQKIET